MPTASLTPNTPAIVTLYHHARNLALHILGTLAKFCTVCGIIENLVIYFDYSRMGRVVHFVSFAFCCNSVMNFVTNDSKEFKLKEKLHWKNCSLLPAVIDNANEFEMHKHRSKILY